jgi:hypothetical protein
MMLNMDSRIEAIHPKRVSTSTPQKIMAEDERHCMLGEKEVFMN